MTGSRRMCGMHWSHGQQPMLRRWPSAPDEPAARVGRAGSGAPDATTRPMASCQRAVTRALAGVPGRESPGTLAAHNRRAATISILRCSFSVKEKSVQIIT